MFHVCGFCLLQVITPPPTTTKDVRGKKNGVTTKQQNKHSLKQNKMIVTGK